MTAVISMLGVGTLAVVTIMALLWWLGIRKRNFSYVDIGWCVNFAVLGAIYAGLGEGWPARKWIIAAMYALWSLRLAAHLAKRIIGEPEEGRYVELRDRWGTHGRLHLKFFVFFQFQAALNTVLSVPLLIACLNKTPGLHPLEYAGMGIWLAGVAGESIADLQLASFKRNPANRGEVCNVGLWRYSRHPNYFFEWTIWIAYAVFALASPWGWFALAMPALMLQFLINVTGVKATEQQALRSKGEKYRQYQRETSTFVPMPPRRTSDG
jgi:steroid 5-alpha reductase family enzyme